MTERKNLPYAQGHDNIQNIIGRTYKVMKAARLNTIAEAREKIVAFRGIGHPVTVPMYLSKLHALSQENLGYTSKKDQVRCDCSGYTFLARGKQGYGKFVRYEAVPHDPDALRDLLRDESRKRERLKPGNFKEHIGRLADEKVLAEAQRLSAAFQSLQAPNSPNGTHFVVEVSPWFERIASSKEHERLFALLPYKTLYLSSAKDRHGVFAFISKDERRDLPLRKQRPSVRAQLKEGQSKKTAAPKKTTVKSKDNDLEV